jgi:pimeloyl-ACP methyl ester carboxylesterase
MTVMMAARVRLVTVDRPGYGRSAPSDNGRLAADAGGLADHLGLGRFAVVGWSGGGQFALAVTAGLQDWVSAVALLGTPAPPTTKSCPGCPSRIPLWAEISSTFSADRPSRQ